MRAVFIGAGSLALMTTQLLLKRNHEVVIIEQEKSQIEYHEHILKVGL